ncbi:hypothetical protein DYU11_22375 [Fibrisoma montanum]|uniref:Glycosyl hydrolase n=1 Tax=Fibrisoma montanum TaxID=2305895 RepID=A0A418M4X5_9BACT|nr:glycoside hydrolase family 30 beta sandwich domain-containing protein [Fibrisoma montanum]RIV20780.1 hypothetical protein DYU11_22375 [Fibrisoma montanum]
MKCILHTWLLLIGPCLLMTCSPGTEAQVTADKAVAVTVDTTKTFQTMVGFGGYNPEKQAERLVNDLGLTIHRGEVGYGFKETPDGPYNFDKANDVSGGTANLLRLKQLGVSTFIATLWSPPAWMKENGSLRGQGDPKNRLKPGMEEALADYCVEYVRQFYQQIGVELYALCVQNEPAFAQSFPSCVFKPTELPAIMALVGRKLANATYADGQPVSTRLFGPEDVQYFPRISEYFDNIHASKEVLQYTRFLAVHGYTNDGVKPTDKNPANWRGTYALAQRSGKTLWMTETSGYSNTWEPAPVFADGETKTLPGAFGLAENIYTALRFGNVSAWVWWRLSVQEDYWIDETLIYKGVPHRFYFTSKQFYRYIRPGAVRVECTSGSDDVLPLAFRHPDGSTTLVLMNRSREPIAIKLAGAGLPRSLRRYLSSPTDNCVTKESITPADIVTMPGRSVMTLTDVN